MSRGKRYVARPRDDAVADGGQAERRVLARDAEIAAEDDLQPAAETGALHRGDRRDRNRLDRRERHVPAPEPIGAEPVARERGEIDARAERAPGPGDEDRTRVRVTRGSARRARQVVDGVVVGRVQLLGTGEGQTSDPVRARGRIRGVRFPAPRHVSA
jgi:hypothetical protein